LADLPKFAWDRGEMKSAIIIVAVLLLAGCQEKVYSGNELVFIPVNMEPLVCPHPQCWLIPPGEIIPVQCEVMDRIGYNTVCCVYAPCWGGRGVYWPLNKCEKVRLTERGGAYCTNVTHYLPEGCFSFKGGLVCTS